MFGTMEAIHVVLKGQAKELARRKDTLKRRHSGVIEEARRYT
jgi:hypothetical protein